MTDVIRADSLPDALRQEALLRLRALRGRLAGAALAVRADLTRGALLVRGAGAALAADAGQSVGALAARGARTANARRRVTDGLRWILALCIRGAVAALPVDADAPVALGVGRARCANFSGLRDAATACTASPLPRYGTCWNFEPVR